MSNTNVETVTSTADRIKLGLAVLVIIAGIVGFSVLESHSMGVRVGVFVGGLVIAALIAWFSEPGRRTLSFGSESYNEMRKVIWPAAYRRRLTSRIPPGGGIERLHQARRRSLSQNKKNQNAAARSGSFSDSKGFRFGKPKAQRFCGLEQAYPDRTGDFACPCGGSFLTDRGMQPDRLGLS